MLTTGVIVLITLLFAWVAGGLNAVAPFITMFFLLAYFMLNAVMLIEQTLSMVSFRPTFAIPRIVPFIGMIGSLFAMILINPIFSLVAIIVTLAIYVYLLRRQLNTPWEDVRSGLFLALAGWAVERVSKMPSAPERTWNPNLLTPVTSTKVLTGNYRFLRAIAAPHGSVRALGIHVSGQEGAVSKLDELIKAFNKDGLSGRSILLESDDFVSGIRTTIEVLDSSLFRSNILYLPALPELDWPEDTLAPGSQEEWVELLQWANAHRLGLVLYAQHPLVGLGQEQVINVWMREQGPDWALSLRLANLDLAVLLAYQVGRNWHGHINLCMVVPDEKIQTRAEQYLNELISLARLPSTTRINVFLGSFWGNLPQAPRADLSILGLQATPDLDFVARSAKIIDASCLFVRDSGDESALA